MEATVKRLVVGMFQTNCYLLIKEGHCLIIDPGKKADRIQAQIGELEVDAIVLTHGHFDHIGAVDDLVKMYHCPVYLHDLDVELVRNSPMNSMNG
ncbi:MAG: MBL fold metallo-hydrolase, partial [Erysipelotrichaceae bacterium]|nr:MBL fold metallo-hydrolase [Erysipelotrichaceae bacterium]